LAENNVNEAARDRCARRDRPCSSDALGNARHLGRRWLDELIADATAMADRIAQREKCSVRKVNMTLSLAFPAPDLIKAAIDGRLPHGMGVTRLAAPPAEWSQHPEPSTPLSFRRGLADNAVI
jgi:hypothetical protein